MGKLGNYFTRKLHLKIDDPRTLVFFITDAQKSSKYSTIINSTRHVSNAMLQILRKNYLSQRCIGLLRYNFLLFESEKK